jgi:flagellar hook assembly protein FlgD
VKLAVFDAQGKHVVTLLDGIRSVGVQTVSWDGTNAGGRRAGSGVYFYKLTTATQTLTRDMVLVE